MEHEGVEKTPSQNILLGTVLIVVAFLCVAIMSAFGKAASAVPASVIVFFQNFISLVLLLPWARAHGVRDLKTRRISIHIVRGLSGVLSQALFFIAVKNMALVDAVLLVNAAPLFIPLVVLIFFHTRITVSVWVSLAVGFVGVLLILRPSAALLENPSALIAVTAALFSAIALVTVNRLSETEASDTILFYYFLISTVATVPFAIADWSMPRGNEWWSLLGVGLFMALAQLFIILAYRHASAQRIAPFNYSVVVFSGLIGWVVWHHVPNLLAIVGLLLVCAGGILTILFSGRDSRGHAIGHGHWHDQPATAGAKR